MTLLGLASFLPALVTENHHRQDPDTCFGYQQLLVIRRNLAAVQNRFQALRSISLFAEATAFCRIGKNE